MTFSIYFFFLIFFSFFVTKLIKLFIVFNIKYIFFQNNPINFNTNYNIVVPDILFSVPFFVETLWAVAATAAAAAAS